jgi:hypothetical protein
VSAVRLFGEDHVAVRAPLRCALFLSRWDGEAFAVSPVSAHVVAERSRHILATEYDTSLAWLHHWAATGLAPTEPSALLETQRDRIESALENACQIVDLKIPRAATPVELAEYVSRHFR